MSDWGEPKTLLDESSGNGVKKNPSGDAAIVGPSENNAKARATGWVAPSAYNYDSSIGATREERETAAKKYHNEMIQELRGAHKSTAGNDFIADVPLWASSAAKYEWKDEYGEVGPEVPELERQLFQDEFINRAGDQFKKMTLDAVEVSVESEEIIEPIHTWEDAGLHPVMLSNVSKCGYANPTAIQGYCVPAILKNFDLIAIAQTGSGKTAAYLIPILSKLMGKAKKLAAWRPRGDKFEALMHRTKGEPLVLVIVPTRELAVQIFDEARRLCYRSMLRPCVAYGGGPRKDQADELRCGCDILIATPGRLLDFMGDGELLTLSRLRYTVIDEADELVSPDWVDDMKAILINSDANQDANHRYMMFSATFPREARALARAHLDQSHIRIKVGRAGSTHVNIRQQVIWVDEEAKRQALFDLLLSMPPARTIVFVNNKRAADFIDDFLYNNGMPSTSIHSDRTQREREDSLHCFRSGKTPILVATGVSARGLDIYNVMHVINYDLPSSTHGGIQEYVHRIGRTARIGNVGSATSFYNDRNEDIAQDLVNLLTEVGQEVPDFLQHLKPEDGKLLEFHDDSGNESDGGTKASGDDAEGGGWGNKNAEGGGWGNEDAEGGGWGNEDAEGGGWGNEDAAVESSNLRGNGGDGVNMMKADDNAGTVQPVDNDDW